ncbi:hypothetical protein PNEG_03487 [Pneumocystis murina B123]|uniref:ATP-dependent helicase IRC3 n=1 Tax=Pneumocystis murina (strain B123) TaxID=1069680 RepID=M7P2D4_PNEMU|nr:hypothetical protein PNEG_03487 [Pneumocystis murina B123]EMR08045.1 hypothetical protein PNEG_03487 [Pneumocystis murina B123]
MKYCQLNNRILRLFLTLSQSSTYLHILQSQRYFGPYRFSSVRWNHLRPYQEACIQACLKSILEGKRRLGISLATGSGKTLIFSSLIERVEPIDPNATQTLIIAHRRELVEQAFEQCRFLYPEKTIDIEMANMHASGLAEITIASVCTLMSHERLKKFDPSRFKLILIDEVHHAAAASYIRILKHFSALNSDSKIIVIGVSATIFRLDGLKLGVAIDHIVYHRDLVDLINEKWLSNVSFTMVNSHIDLSKIKDNQFGDFERKALSSTVNTRPTNDICVRTWMKKASFRKSTLVFCISTAHCIDMANTFRSYGIDARIVTWKTPKSERYKLIEDFQKQEYPVLINCGILTEGTDIPNIDCILLARPTKSHNLFIQMIGRGMRLFPGKEDCHVIDMVGNISNGIVTVPTLFGLDPNEISHEISLNELKRIRNDKKEKRCQSSKNSQKYGISYVSSNIEQKEWNFTYDFIKQFQADLDVRRFSNFSWVRINSDKYILSIPLYGFIKVDKENDLYHASETLRIINSAKKSNAFYKKPRLIFSNVVSLKHAISAVDTYVKNKYPQRLLLKNASWRRSPATSSQIEFLRKRYPLITQNINNISKGYAWDLITRLKYGSKSK